MCCRLLESVEESWLVSVEGRVAVVLALVAAASVLGGACSSLSCCDGPVDCHPQAFVVVLWLRLGVSVLGVLRGRLVGSVIGMGLVLLTAVASALYVGMSGGHHTVWQMHDQVCL